MPNIMITIESHDICEKVIVNTNNFNDEMKSLYKEALRCKWKTAYIEGYPTFVCGVPGGIPEEKMPCVVDDEFTISCNL